MGNFTFSYLDDSKSMEIVLKDGFSSDDQDELMKLYQERASKGVIYWDVNLKEVDLINSTTLGLLVALNASVISRNGNLRLILNRQSKVTDLLFMAKLDKIMRFIIT